MFGLEKERRVSDGGGGYKLSETTLQQGGLWDMVHNVVHPSVHIHVADILTLLLILYFYLLI